MDEERLIHIGLSSIWSLILYKPKIVHMFMAAVEGWVGTSPSSQRGPEGQQGDRAFPTDLSTHQAQAQTRRRTEDHVLSACL